ncbi:hypothetical protein FRC11_014201 [Ceratobasidium sp. 423]|nr:hypothetical protein FRC11_014201 [Ceratobasidium sp. 423]
MSNPLHPDDHAKWLTNHDHDILSSIKRDPTSRSSSRPLGTYIEDGFYRIVQRQQNQNIADACLSAGPGGQSGYPVVMSATSQLQDRVWRLTRQYGMKNAFTIVPQDTPTGGADNPKYGGTACAEDGSVHVRRSSCFPIWNVEYQDHKVSRNRKTDVITEYFFFSILEVGSNKGWTTGEDANIRLKETPDENLPANQLFELVEATNEQTVTISSLKELSVVASNATVVRKFYFGTEKLGADNLSRFLSVQLETDAHDQGWASEPKRGLWSWFELAIFTTLPAEGQEVTLAQIKPNPAGGGPLTWISHRLPLSKKYDVKRGEDFTKDHEIWKFLEPGDHIGVLACAQYRKWEGDVRSGKLTFREMGIRGD